MRYLVRRGEGYSKQYTGCSSRHDHPMLMKQTLYASQLHWIAGNSPSPLSSDMPSTNRTPPSFYRTASWSPLEKDICQVEFERPQRSYTRAIRCFLPAGCLPWWWYYQTGNINTLEPAGLNLDDHEKQKETDALLWQGFFRPLSSFAGGPQRHSGYKRHGEASIQSVSR